VHVKKFSYNLEFYFVCVTGRSKEYLMHCSLRRNKAHMLRSMFVVYEHENVLIWVIAQVKLLEDWYLFIF
jgi:hypothetical protein